jgi:hypothetical protein
VIVTEVASVEVHVRVADWPATMDCDDAVSVTVGTGLVRVSGVGVVVVLLLLLPPLPHALKKSTTPATAATSNIEGFRRAMGRLAGLVLLEQYRPNDHSVPLATTPGSGRIYKKQFFRPELAQAEAEYCRRWQAPINIGDTGSPARAAEGAVGDSSAAHPLGRTTSQKSSRVARGGAE